MIYEEKAKVNNASDPEQVKEAGKREETQREQELRDLKAVLSMPEGRRFVWRLMDFCGPFKTCWAPNAKIHYNSGQQDVGHFLMGEIVQADGEAMISMMRDKYNEQVEQEAKK
jgi:hypothetical protein